MIYYHITSLLVVQCELQVHVSSYRRGINTTQISFSAVYMDNEIYAKQYGNNTTSQPSWLRRLSINTTQIPLGAACMDKNMYANNLVIPHQVSLSAVCMDILSQTIW